MVRLRFAKSGDDPAQPSLWRRSFGGGAQHSFETAQQTSRTPFHERREWPGL